MIYYPMWKPNGSLSLHRLVLEFQLSGPIFHVVDVHRSPLVLMAVGPNVCRLRRRIRYGRRLNGISFLTLSYV